MSFTSPIVDVARVRSATVHRPHTHVDSIYRYMPISNGYFHIGNSYLELTPAR